MGSGGKSGKKAAGAVIGVAGGGGGHADGPGGAAGGVAAGGSVDVSAPATIVSPAMTWSVATLHIGVSKVVAASKAHQPTAKGVLAFIAGVKPVAEQFDAAFKGDPEYKEVTYDHKVQLWAAAKDAAVGYLEGVPKSELQKAAAAAGFKYPQLIGKKDPKGSGLAFWLNPFYSSPVSLKKKKLIQDKALLYYNELPDHEKQAADQAAEQLAAEALGNADLVAQAGQPDADSAVAQVGSLQPAAAKPTSEAALTEGQQAQPPKVELPKLIANIKTGFTDLLKSLAGLALTRDAAKKLPAWRGREAVRKLVWQYEGSAGHLGGVHEKHIYHSPDGQRWLFKPDKKGGGAVAAAEEAAAEIARRAGLPAVEVRMVRIGGKVGSVQPLVADPGKAQELLPDPAQWTPEQRAAVLAQHVVDWVVGDHDGNHQNFLLVGNVPVRIDRGQAFKFYGEDSLSLDYEPNKVHGAPPHAALALCRAAKAGKAQINPLLVAPVIRAVEAIPDGEYREILRPVAEAGAKSGKAGWYRAAKARAAVKTGKAEPSEKDIAEAFLDMAVQRKNSVRQAFEAFYSSVLGQPFAFPAPAGGDKATAASGMQPAVV